jgi:hypothetical protein
MVRTIACLSLLAAFSVASNAAADGMVFRTTAATGEPLATTQRALLWQRDGVWEVHIQPRFDRETGAAAWVVPFPVRPTISEGSAALLDQLERLTAPLFVEQCHVPCCSDVCDGGTETDLRAGETDVTVWETGTVGSLDYAILSAGAGDSLAAWLDTEGYVLPAGAVDLLAAFDTEGAFFFASRLAAGADPDLPVAPVRFVLPGLTAPTYPLRLTALGVPAGETLDLTVWVVFPLGTEGQGFMPSSHPYGTLNGSSVTDAASFHTALDAFFAGHDPGAFAYLFGQQLSGSPVRRVCNDFHSCENYVDPEPPEWTAEILEMATSRAMLQRYHGRLSATAMATDFALEEREELYVLEEDDAFTTFTGYCFTCPVDEGEAGTDASTDTATDTGADAGADGPDLEPEAGGGGCTCAVGSRPTRPFGLLFLLPALLLLRRRGSGTMRRS